MLNVIKGNLSANRNKIFCKKSYANVASIIKDDRNKESRKEGIQELGNDGPKLIARKPLVKNFFVGEVDKELLGYPEVISREDSIELNESLQPIRNFFYGENYAEIEESKRLENIQSLGLYGLNVPKEYDGKGYKWTESLYATEAEVNDTNFAFGLLSHRVVIDLINIFGTNEQKTKYLQKLATGTLIATEAVYEDNTLEDSAFSTSVEFDYENNNWILNGEKTLVVTDTKPNGSANLFLVTAQVSTSGSVNEHNTSFFLVESTLPGVTLCAPDDILGSTKPTIQNVKFENVKISDENRIGKPNENQIIAELLFKSNRLRCSMVGLGLAKSILNNISEYCVTHKYSGVPLKDIELPKFRLASSFCNVYAMESMIYLTSGLMDEFTNQDLSLESAVTKYFTLTNVQKMALDPLDYIGPTWLHPDAKKDLMLRNAIQLYTNTERIDSLRMYIGLSGLQHAGVIMHDVIQKSRNPLFNPGHIFSKLLNSSNIENPKTNMRLNENVHPTLAPAAQYIEQSAIRLKVGTEILFTRYGNDIVERHRDLQRLADMSTLIYAMFASVARASRSYCIGLPNADKELLTASTICTFGQNEINNICTEIRNGQYMNNDNNLTRLANQVSKSKGYFAESPLSFNF